MKSEIMENYIRERCGELSSDPSLDAYRYYSKLRHSGAKIKEYDFGFSTFRKVGDALVVADIYLLPEFRRVENQKYGWQLFKDLRDEARLLGLNLIIGFSEHGGQNKKAGEIAMRTAGFKKCYETAGRDIYMRGVE